MKQFPNILHYYGATNAAYLHPKGKWATDLLSEKLNVQDHESVLEIGFGTGASLVYLASKHPKANFYGIERSELMYEKGKRRIAFTSSKNISPTLHENVIPLPFADAFFDKVYAESVLAIQDGKDLPILVAEIHRILKPNGKLVINEGIWNDSFSKENILEMNAFCQSKFGIIQANSDYPYISDWKNMFEKCGFFVESATDLEITNPIKRQPIFEGIASKAFTLYGKFVSKTSVAYRRQFSVYRNSMNEANTKGNYLKGYIIECQKKKA